MKVRLVLVNLNQVNDTYILIEDLDAPPAAICLCTVLRCLARVRMMPPMAGLVGSWGGGAVDGASVNAFLAAAITRVMRAAVPIPAVASASVFHSAAVVGSVVGIVGPL